MRKKIAFLMTLALVTTACGHAEQTRGAGINLGKQAATITLTSGNNNDVKVANNQGMTGIVRMVANASGSTLTGLDASTAADGDLLWIRNDASSGNITLTSGDSNSLAANRFTTPGSVSQVVVPHQSIMLEYDATAGWVTGGKGTDTFNGNLVVASTGHMLATGSAPALSSCGSTPSPTIVGSDVAGTVTTGGTATTCTITFATTYGTAPSCILRPQGTATQPVYTTSATAITVTTDIAQTVYDYICVGH